MCITIILVAAETIPADVRDEYADWCWTPAWTFDGRVTVWRLTRDDATHYLKVGTADASFPVTLEATKLRWAASRVRVPHVVAAGTSDGLDWMVTKALAGVDATQHPWRSEPARLVPVFARGLRRFHDSLRVSDCPFRLTLDDALLVCRQRIDEGVTTIDSIHDEYKPLGVEGAFAELVRLRPTTENLVVCHGDYCFPNVLLEDGEVTGYLDLGELAVADRWLDVAIGMWSTTWNVGPGYEQLFLEHYGADADDDRLHFNRLLYALIS